MLKLNFMFLRWIYSTAHGFMVIAGQSAIILFTIVAL